MRKLILAFVGVALAAWAASAAEKEALPVLEVVGRFAVPEQPSGVLMDLRWAGKDSIYLADLHAGVTEVRLKEGLPEIRRITPRTAQTGLPILQHLAISEKWIAAAHQGRLGWTAVDGHWQVQSDIGNIHELDIRGNELVVIGSPNTETYERSRGGMLWRADLSRGLDHWEVLYESEKVAQDFGVMRQDAALGSVRFLPRGGFVVAPNFLPEVLLFSPSGSLMRRWSYEELWGTGEDGKEEGLGKERGWRDSRFEVESLRRFLAEQRTIDEILPLPQGPAIVVREPKGAEARYRLGVLSPEIRWYDIPISNVSALARLRGDADENGRIVLVGVERGPQARLSSNEIFVFRLPR